MTCKSRKAIRPSRRIVQARPPVRPLRASGAIVADPGSPRSRPSALFPALLLLGLLSPAVPAAAAGADAAAKVTGEAPLRPLAAPIVRVALFKNGLGIVTREGSPGEGPGAYEIRPLPNPMHGTVWVATTPGVRVAELRAERAEGSRSVAAATLPELLRANVGREVALYLGGEDLERGRIREIASSAPEAGPLPPAPTPWDPRPAAILSIPVPRPESVILERADGSILVVPLASVQRAAFAGDPARTLVVPETVERLRVRLDEAARGGTFRLTYATAGISWAPSMRIDLGPEGKATASLSALLVNEAEDLDRARVDLVTGFPNLRFAGVPSPLSLDLDLATFLQRLREAAEGGRPEGGPLAMQVANYRAAESYAGVVAAVSYGPAASGTTAEDLHFYPLPAVTLPRGSSAWFPLFSAEVPARHVYEWTIPDYVSGEDVYVDRRGGEAPTTDVWHSLRLENATAVPWTTCPAETVSDGMVLGQDMLPFTPAGAETTLRITKALTVRAEETEREVERQRDALVQHGRHYDRVKVQGELEVTNGLSRPIDLEVRKTVSGDLGDCSVAPEVTARARGLRRVNPTLDLLWKPSVGPGESRTILYSYSVLVAR